jgi:hypothetical protein
MSTRLETLAADKEALLMRSALCRLRLRRATHGLRVSLDWKRASFVAASASLVPPVAFGLALSFIGAGRVARVLKLAGRIVVFAKLTRFAIGLACSVATSRRALPNGPAGKSPPA